ncbi:hypothetical protein [Rhizobium indigoferae]|uniref:Uncharacterized protein n=1 Tax=Rhizobium indigoferae TaxID=158891 RepID=A0ABZ0ZAM1_9HYPH|nr:hypothetical protein [Rhizobium indigoferae]NNU55068.1 hypothetical protein [Rhizobium indigoferae]WQN36637.1 hypothetical protein U5G49_001726 [Rhizobium indigoferae]GLR61165.1 hypothetical protein GCM10007919_58940 [Rhizobium indigoferae]
MENHLKADDATPHLANCRCGFEPVPEYGPTSIVTCPNCSEFVAITTPAFFAHPVRQREMRHGGPYWHGARSVHPPVEIGDNHG